MCVFCALWDAIIILIFYLFTVYCIKENDLFHRKFSHTTGGTKSVNNVADLVVFGTVYTAEDNKVCEAFAVKDGKYVYVGDREGAEGYIERGVTKVIDI